MVTPEKKETRMERFMRNQIEQDAWRRLQEARRELAMRRYEIYSRGLPATLARVKRPA